jgi:hypothetical protein
MAFTIVAAVLGLSIPAAVLAQQGPPSPPTVGITSCRASVLAILPIPSSDSVSTGASEYEAMLGSSDGPSVGSGSFRVNASGVAYRITFVKRSMLSYQYRGEIDPITFRLPRAVVLESAFVDARYEPGVGACATDAIWKSAFTLTLPPMVATKVATARVTPPAVAEVVTDPASVCHVPDIGPKVLQVGPVLTPPNFRFVLPGYEVRVSVRLNADSSIRDTSIQKTENSALNSSALDAARSAIFRTRIHNCLSEPSEYVFFAEYRPDIVR